MGGARPRPSAIGGYVLAGGKSSRMGRDKALLELGGKPLILRAVVKLRRVCVDVSAVSANETLDAYAPLVRDVHAGCGPMGGMEAALLHTAHAWNLFMPVDMPFVPTAYLGGWIRQQFPLAAQRGARVLMFKVNGLPQPTMALVHRDVQPFLTRALDECRYKLFPVLEQACEQLSLQKGLLPGVGLWNLPYARSFCAKPGPERRKADWCYTTEAQEQNSGIWFSNVNTPEEFLEAERHLDVLDT